MEAEIGHAAGILWRYLDEHGATTMARLEQRTKLPERLLLMACGWLAREGKLTLVKGGRALQVSLKEH